MARLDAREQARHQRWQERQRSAKARRSKPNKPERGTVQVARPSDFSIGSMLSAEFTVSKEDLAARRKEREQKAKETLDYLASLPGMAHVKTQVEHMLALKEVANKRKAAGLKVDQQTLHMAFLGNPGTGKTTAARLIGKAFIYMGLLKSTHEEPPFVEVVQSDIISSFVGGAEQNIKKKFYEARGGVIFFDEAYALNGPYEWNKNMLATMVSCVEDMRDEVLCIIAGYNDEMQEFLDANPGLRSRFPSHIDFPDYELENLIDIAEMMATERDYKISTSTVARLMKRLEGERKLRSFGNARTVRNVMEEAIRRHSLRMRSIENPTKEQLMTLTGDDINTEVKAPKETAGKKAGKMDGGHHVIMIQQQQHDPKMDPWNPAKGTH